MVRLLSALLSLELFPDKQTLVVARVLNVGFDGNVISLLQ
jgi:hypothetical protein